MRFDESEGEEQRAGHEIIIFQSLTNVHTAHAHEWVSEQSSGRGNNLFERWMESVYGNDFNDVPWKKKSIFLNKQTKQRLYQLMKTVESVTVALMFFKPLGAATGDVTTSFLIARIR